VHRLENEFFCETLALTHPSPYFFNKGNFQLVLLRPQASSTRSHESRKNVSKKTRLSGPLSLCFKKIKPESEILSQVLNDDKVHDTIFSSFEYQRTRKMTKQGCLNPKVKPTKKFFKKKF
jgi:hypothetical protein